MLVMCHTTGETFFLQRNGTRVRVCVADVNCAAIRVSEDEAASLKQQVRTARGRAPAYAPALGARA